LKRAPNCPCRNERSVRRRWWWWWWKTVGRKHKPFNLHCVVEWISAGFSLAYYI